MFVDHAPITEPATLAPDDGNTSVPFTVTSSPSSVPLNLALPLVSM